MKIVIYGAGSLGEQALYDIGKGNVLCFVDKIKIGTIDGCTICKLSELKVDNKDEVFFLITSHKHRHEIADGLASEGYRHFCLYTHIQGGTASQALNASQWGELYNGKMLKQIIADVQNHRMKSWSSEMLHLTKPGNRVLEIGCGSGATTLHLASNQRECMAIDYSQASIDLVNKAAEQLGLPVRTKCIDARKELPFADSTFDFVFQAGLLEHFQREDRVHLLRLWKRVGRIMVSMIPNANSIAYRAGKYLQEQSGDWEYGMELPQATMIDEFYEAGLVNVREYTIGIKDAMMFLPREHYLRVALEKWFTEHREDTFGQGYLLCTIGESEA